MDAFWILVLLIVLSGYFALAEMALASARRSRLVPLAENGDHRAAQALAIKDNPSRLLAATQTGITAAALLSGVFGESALNDTIVGWISRWLPFIVEYQSEIALTVTIIVVTAFSIVFGEIVPKRIAIDKPEKISCLLARPMLYFSILCTPVVWILSWSTAMVTKIMGVNKPEVLPVTEDEIKLLLEQGVELGAFEKEEPELVDRVFRLADMDVGDIMTNRTQVDWIDVEDPEETIMQELVAFNHNTLPVGRGSLDDFIGMISVSEIFQKYLFKYSGKICRTLPLKSSQDRAADHSDRHGRRTGTGRHACCN